MPPPPPPPRPAVADPWLTAKDDATGDTYYYKQYSQEVQWERPADFPAPASLPRQANESVRAMGSAMASGVTASAAMASRVTATVVQVAPMPLFSNEAADSPVDTPRDSTEELADWWVTKELKWPGDVAVEWGRIEFPGSKRLPAKWARVPDVSVDDKDELKNLINFCMQHWRLRQPSVIISVTGGTNPGAGLTEKQKVLFKRGLTEAVTRACLCDEADEDDDGAVPWIITGGTRAGVMELIGMVMSQDELASLPIPCIGIAPYGIINQRDEFMVPARQFRDSAAAAAPSTRSHLREGSISKGSSSSSIDEQQRKGPRYVYEAPAKKLPDGEVLLDWGHTHFLLVDSRDPQTRETLTGKRAFGSERQFRVQFERQTCDTVYGSDKDGDKLPRPALVLIALGGGPGTFEVIHRTLEARRPVMCFVGDENGGASKAVYEYVFKAGAEEGLSLEQRMKFVELPVGNTAFCDAARTYLEGIRKFGLEKHGVNEEKQLTCPRVPPDCH